MTEEFDFIDYIVKYDSLYTSGKIFEKDIFKGCDGYMVPIVYGTPKDPNEVSMYECFGHAFLENKEDGVVAKCKFIDTEFGRFLKSALLNNNDHGLSFYGSGITSDNHVEFGRILGVMVLPKWRMYTIIPRPYEHALID